MKDNKYTNENYYDEYEFEVDIEELEDAIGSMRWETGIKDISSSDELTHINNLIEYWAWCSDVVRPEKIKEHILTDIANVAVFEGEITPEVFDAGVRECLKELAEPQKYCQISDFIPDEDNTIVNVQCGGVITGKNRYIYCFYDDAAGIFFGKEFFVDKEGKIHSCTKEWMVSRYFERFGKDEFWEAAYDCIKHEEIDLYSCYVSGLITLYSMAKYVAEKRKEENKAA